MRRRRISARPNRLPSPSRTTCRSSSARRNKKSPAAAGLLAPAERLFLGGAGRCRAADLRVERVRVVRVLGDAEPQELLVAERLPLGIHGSPMLAFSLELFIKLVRSLLRGFHHGARERAQLRAAADEAPQRLRV